MHPPEFQSFHTDESVDGIAGILNFLVISSANTSAFVEFLNESVITYFGLTDST